MAMFNSYVKLPEGWHIMEIESTMSELLLITNVYIAIKSPGK